MSEPAKGSAAAAAAAREKFELAEGGDFKGTGATDI